MSETGWKRLWGVSAGPLRGRGSLSRAELLTLCPCPAVASGDQSFPVRLHQWHLLHPPLPAPGSPQNAPADPPALGPWVQTRGDVGSARAGGPHREPSGPLERDVPVHGEVCPRRWHLLQQPVHPEAVLPARPPPHRHGVGHAGGGLSLGCRGLHVTHHCHQDALREREVRLRERLRRPAEHLPPRGPAGPLQRPDGDAAARRTLLRNLPDVLHPDQKPRAPRPAGLGSCSRRKLQLRGTCWRPGLAGDSARGCHQNSHAALPSEISVVRPGGDHHLQGLWAAWLLPGRSPPGPAQDADGSHGVDSLRRDDGQDGPEVLTARAPGRDGTRRPAWCLPGGLLLWLSRRGTEACLESRANCHLVTEFK